MTCEEYDSLFTYTPNYRNSVGGAASDEVALESTSQAIHQLDDDIRAAAFATPGLTHDQGFAFGQLFVEYDQFRQEFDGFYAAETSGQAGSLDTASLKSYEARYEAYRTRFKELGGSPSSDLIVPQDSGDSGTSWKTYLFWGGVILAGIVVLPYAVGPAFLMASSKK